MTVATEYYNWQNHKVGEPYTRNSPNLDVIRGYLIKKYSGQHLGTYSVRPVRGGTRPSSHSFGAAMDWRYQNPGPGRSVLMNEILPFLIDHSKELGIQAIHDYFGCQVWHAGRGWQPQRKGSHGGSMGQPWATWIHIETNQSSWGNTKSIEERIGFAVVDDPENHEAPVFDPAEGKFGLYPLAKNKQHIRIGARGDIVRYLQGVILNKAGGGVVVDGNFGAQTQRRVMDLQRFTKAKQVDGIVGPDTWAVIDKLAAG